MIFWSIYIRRVIVLKKILSALIAVLMIFTVSAYAAPVAIYPGEASGNGDLIVIQNPPTDKAATFDKSYIISGYGRPGASVVMYIYDGSVYKKSDYTWTIGASGLFFKKITHCNYMQWVNLL